MRFRERVPLPTKSQLAIKESIQQQPAIKHQNQHQITLIIGKIWKWGSSSGGGGVLVNRNQIHTSANLHRHQLTPKPYKPWVWVIQVLWCKLTRAGRLGPVSLTLLIAKRIAKSFIAKSANVVRILSYRFTLIIWR